VAAARRDDGSHVGRGEGAAQLVAATLSEPAKKPSRSNIRQSNSTW